MDSTRKLCRKWSIHFRRVEINQVIKVKKNPLYWDADRVKLNEIHFLPIDNVSREDFMFRSGQIHVTSSIPTEKIEVYKEEYPQNINISPLLWNLLLSVQFK